MARKRGNSEGSIYQRKDGAWVAAISVGTGEDGKPKRRTAYAKTRREAAEKLDKLRAEIAGGIIAGKDGVSVEELIAEYLAHKGQTWRPASLRTATSICTHHITKPIGKVKLRDLDIRRVALWLRAEGTSRTTQIARSHLLAACSLAVQWGWLLRNPVEPTSSPPPVRKKPAELSAEQIRAIIAATQAEGAPPVADLVALMIGLGLRVSEVLGLRWDDWDKAAKRLHVRQQLARVEGEYRLAPPKTKSATRTLAVPDFVAAAIERRRGNEAGEMKLIFTSDKGAPLNLSDVSASVRVWVFEVAAVHMTSHDLRHAHASYLLDCGVPITVVSAVLGHSNPSITMAVYAHKLKGSHEQVAAIMDRLTEPKG